MTIDIKKAQERLNALYQDYDYSDKKNDDKFLLGRELTGIKNTLRWESMSDEQKAERYAQIQVGIDKRQQDPEYHRKTHEGIQSEERKKKISKASKETWKKQGTARVKNIVAAKKETGSIISDELILAIYNDKAAWTNDRLYGAVGNLADKHGVSVSQASAAMNNQYNLIPQDVHDKNIEEWKKGPAEKWIVYSPSIKWLDLYDAYNAQLGDSLRCHIPPSELWKARQMEKQEAVVYLLENFGHLYNSSTEKIRRNAMQRILAKTFDFLVDEEPQQYIFYTLSEAVEWANEKSGGSYKPQNMGAQFRGEGKQVAWKARGFRGWIFERVNKNDKGKDRHER